MTVKEFHDYVKNYVEHPSHYNQGKVECIDAMESAFGKASVIDFCILNAFKYLWRCKDKENFRTDLEKAQWYIGKALEECDEADTD